MSTDKTEKGPVPEGTPNNPGKEPPPIDESPQHKASDTSTTESSSPGGDNQEADFLKFLLEEVGIKTTEGSPPEIGFEQFKRLLLIFSSGFAVMESIRRGEGWDSALSQVSKLRRLLLSEGEEEEVSSASDKSATERSPFEEELRAWFEEMKSSAKSRGEKLAKELAMLMSDKHSSEDSPSKVIYLPLSEGFLWGLGDEASQLMSEWDEGSSSKRSMVEALREVLRRYSTVGGGKGNRARGKYSTIGGGQKNIALDYHCTIRGGLENNTSDSHSTVGGGSQNSADSNRSTVGGGFGNTASGESITVSGGLLNTAESLRSTVGGGYRNRASGSWSTIGGGIGNEAGGEASAIGGGSANEATGDNSAIRGGIENTVSGLFSTVGGGIENKASGQGSTIGGGFRSEARGAHSTVRGGSRNKASGIVSTVGGGCYNKASGQGSTIGGGDWSEARGAHSTVRGGRWNTASGIYSTVGGGIRNEASGQGSTIGGGGRNTTMGKGSVVIGGAWNAANGDCSVVLGGAYNTANGRYNLVFGQGVIPAVAEDYRVYFFGDGSLVPEEASGSDESKSEEPKANPSGFVVINRLQGSHPIHVGTNGKNGNGAYLSAGGVWTDASSRTKKDRFHPLDAGEVLERIRALPVEGWYYKGTNEYHIGPYAEDFHEAFGTGVLDNPEDARTSLAASDVAGVALLGIQALAERDEAYERRMAALEAANRKMRASNAELQAKLEALRARQAACAAKLKQLWAKVSLTAKEPAQP